MPEIPITSPLDYAGISLLLLGFFLTLAGFGIIRIEKVTVKPGTKTWTFGVVLIVIGLGFLLPEIVDSFSNPSIVTTSPAPTSPATLAAPVPSFHVIEVDLQPEHYKWVGRCPITVSFSARITVDSGGTVKYQFVLNDGTVLPEETLVFQSPGSKVIHGSWEFGASYTGSKMLRIIEPQKIESNKMGINIACS